MQAIIKIKQFSPSHYTELATTEETVSQYLSLLSLAGGKISLLSQMTSSVIAKENFPARRPSEVERDVIISSLETKTPMHGT